jgi:hypothetical protein
MVHCCAMTPYEVPKVKSALPRGARYFGGAAAAVGLVSPMVLAGS